jgi:hypothetical protein
MAADERCERLGFTASPAIDQFAVGIDGLGETFSR